MRPGWSADVTDFGQKGSGGAGLHAFTTGNAGAFTHRIVKIEDNFGFRSALGHTDNIIDLNFAAGAYAEGTVDASVQIDRHRRMAWVRAG